MRGGRALERLRFWERARGLPEREGMPGAPTASSTEPDDPPGCGPSATSPRNPEDAGS